MSTLATQATDLELLQLQTAVEHLLSQPVRMIGIRQQLHVGQTVQYLDVRDNRMHAAKVIEAGSNSDAPTRSVPAQLGAHCTRLPYPFCGALRMAKVVQTTRRNVGVAAIPHPAER